MPLTSGWVFGAILTAGAGLLSDCQTTPLLPPGPVVYYRQIGACNGADGAPGGPNTAFLVYQIDTIDNQGATAFAFDPTKLSPNASSAVKSGTPPVQIPRNINGAPTAAPILSALGASPAQTKTVAPGQQSDLPPGAYGVATVGTGAADGAAEADAARYFLIYATPANDPPVIPTMLDLARTAWPYTPACDDIRPGRGQNAYVDHEGMIFTFKIDPATGALTNLGVPVPDTLVPNDVNPGLLVVDPRGHFLFTVDQSANELLTFNIHAADGSLAAPNQTAAPVSGVPSAMVIDPAGRFLYALNVTGIDIFRLDPATGAPTSAGHIASDSIESIAVDGGGAFLYALASPLFTGETLTAYAIDPSSGTLNQVSSLVTQKGYGYQDFIAISPLNGDIYLAGLNTPQGVRIFTFDRVKPALAEPFAPTPLPGPAESLIFSAGGGFLYAQDNQLAVHIFSVLATGTLQPLATPAVPAPTYLYTEPTGRFLYLHDTVHLNVTGYKLNPRDGALTALPGFPVATPGTQRLTIPGVY